MHIWRVDCNLLHDLIVLKFELVWVNVDQVLMSKLSKFDFIMAIKCFKFFEYFLP